MSAEYDFWTTPADPETGRCVQDPCCCIVCGNGDPSPEEGGAIPVDPDENGKIPGWS